MPVTFASPLGLLTIAAGSGADTVTVSSIDSGFAGSLIVQGDDGADTVTISGTLNLTGQTLTVTAETANFNAATAAQNLTVTGTAVSQTAPLTVSGTATFNAATVTLADANNDFHTVQATGTNATLVDKNAIDLGTVSLTGSFSLTAGGLISNGAGASVSVSNNANFSGPSIDLGNQTSDTMNFGSLTFTSGGAVSVREDSSTHAERHQHGRQPDAGLDGRDHRPAGLRQPDGDEQRQPERHVAWTWANPDERHG